MLSSILALGAGVIFILGNVLVVTVSKALEHVNVQIVAQKDLVNIQKHVAQQREKKQDFLTAHITCMHWAKMSKEERVQIGVSDFDMKRCNAITKVMVKMVAKAAEDGDKFIDHNFQNDVEQKD